MKRQYVSSDSSVQVDVVSTPSGAMSIRVDGREFDGEVLEKRTIGRTLFLVIRAGTAIREVIVHRHDDEFEVANRSARCLVSRAANETAEVAAGGRAQSREVRAPMPGRVVRIFVKAGEHVRRGQPLFVVEAMKMENEIKAPVDGVIGTIRVAEGESVETRAVMLVFEQ